MHNRIVCFISHGESIWQLLFLITKQKKKKKIHKKVFLNTGNWACHWTSFMWHVTYIYRFYMDLVAKSVDFLPPSSLSLITAGSGRIIWCLLTMAHGLGNRSGFAILFLHFTLSCLPHTCSDTSSKSILVLVSHLNFGELALLVLSVTNSIAWRVVWHLFLLTTCSNQPERFSHSLALIAAILMAFLLISPVMQ